MPSIDFKGYFIQKITARTQASTQTNKHTDRQTDRHVV